MSSAPQTLSISLVSHTNTGKTTLARTLLDRDIGTIRDQAHVTDTIESFVLAETPDGSRLLLWDTPGFGDSVRLAKRLEQSDQSWGWIKAQVWDRLGDRALWSSQQALTHVREASDLVLYLVNAAEDPDDIGYLDAEMRILAWAGRPVIVLLNQLGPPRPAETEAAEVALWRQHFSGYAHVRSVIALDAFARCWVQESALFDEIVDCFEADARQAAIALTHVRRAHHQHRLREAAELIAGNVLEASDDQVVLPADGIVDTLRGLGGMLGMPGAALRRRRDEAMVAMASRWDESLRRTTTKLLSLHGLDGQATVEIMTRVAGHFTINERISEGKAAVVGGVTTGALAGLKADLATGGFTLGGGMLAGGIAGALGAAGLARGINLIRGVDGITIEWSAPVLLGKVQTLCLSYLAVAHFGRGRGQWVRGEYPEHWGAIVEAALKNNQKAFEVALKAVREQPDDDRPADETRRVKPLAEAFETLLADILRALYPASANALERKPAND